MIDDETGERASQASLKTLGNALRVLELIAAAEFPPKIGEISRELGLSRPTTYRLVQSLVGEGYVIQDEPDGRLTMGFVILELAGSLLEKNRLRREALPHMHRLAHETNERVSLGVLSRNRIYSIAQIVKPTLPSVYSRYGKPVPAHSCGLGKAILAFIPTDELHAIAKVEPLVARTPNTITTLPELEADLAEVRLRGYAIDRAEGTMGSFCVAAPVFGPDGRPIGAISISARSLDIVEPHAPLLQECAELLSHTL